MRFLRSYLDWRARSDVADGQGGKTRTYAAAVRLRAEFAAVLTGPEVRVEQLTSRTRGQAIVELAGRSVHEGDHVTTPDSRTWTVKSVAPYAPLGVPVSRQHLAVLDLVEVYGD